MNPIILQLVPLFVDLFRKRRFLRDEVLPLVDGVSNLPDAAERRALVIGVLMKKGLTETEARLLTETGVRLWKKLEKKRLKKLAKLAAKEAR